MKTTIIYFLLAMFLAPLGMEAKKKEEVPQLLNYPSADWGEYRMHGGDVVIKGQVIADDPAKIKQLNNSVEVIMRDYIVRKEQTIPIKFEEDGIFSLNLRVPYPMFVLVYPLAQVYACPGDTVNTHHVQVPHAPANRNTCGTPRLIAEMEGWDGGQAGWFGAPDEHWAA